MTSISDKVKGKNNGGRNNRPYGINGKKTARASGNPSERLRIASKTDSPNDSSNYETISRERGS